MKLTNRVILVTGASKGIGAAIAVEAAREGADVVVNNIGDRAGVEEVLSQVRQLGRRGLAVEADVGVKAEVDKLVAAGIEALGKIDVLVNNAGVALWKPFLDLDEANWDQTSALI